MIKPGDVISYPELCLQEGYSVQRGMNFKVKNGVTVVLMSQRKGAPYVDRIREGGRVLIYEGHDVPKNLASNPKSVDQRDTTPSGKLTENGKFMEAVRLFRNKGGRAELVHVYEKIRDGIWVFNGVFKLVDGKKEKHGGRKVFKFRLDLTNYSLKQAKLSVLRKNEIKHNRIIPSQIKLEVWKRDKGKCTMCGRKDNLHFDHILPFSKGGTSIKVENVQLLCARHNLVKRDRII